jgi:hypothetical protein
MAKNTDAWLQRAKEILEKGHTSHEVIPSAGSMLAALYGPRSAQLEAFNSRMQEISRLKEGVNFARQRHAYATVQSIVAEIESGLIVNIRAQVAGEVMSELVGLGKEILANGTDPATNVSAVLIAAAFEDLMRRMGSELASVVGRPKLEDVVVALKTAGVLNGSEVGIALSYLQFRNHSLHAEWAKVEKSQVQSCIGFIEALLLKHFS